MAGVSTSARGIFGYEGDTAREALQVPAGRCHRETDHPTLVATIGFRNVLAHEYGHVDAGAVSETLQTELTVYDRGATRRTMENLTQL